MKVIIDTNVLLDAIMNRDEFKEKARIILSSSYYDKFEGFITANAITDLAFLLHRAESQKRQNKNKDHKESEISLKDYIRRQIYFLIYKVVDVIDTTKDDVEAALGSGMSDYEDAVMVECGKRAEIECIISRDEDLKKQSPIPVYTPTEFIKEFPSFVETMKTAPLPF